jgi:hypothetical protein
MTPYGEHEKQQCDVFQYWCRNRPEENVRGLAEGRVVLRFFKLEEGATSGPWWSLGRVLNRQGRCGGFATGKEKLTHKFEGAKAKSHGSSVEKWSGIVGLRHFRPPHRAD